MIILNIYTTETKHTARLHWLMTLFQRTQRLLQSKIWPQILVNFYIEVSAEY